MPRGTTRQWDVTCLPHLVGEVCEEFMVSTSSGSSGAQHGYDRSQVRWNEAARPDLWDLPPGGFRRVRTVVGRALARRCPYCGARHIYRNWFALNDTCPRCHVRFEREEGYFVGAYAVNLVAALFIGIAIVIGALIFTDLSVLQLQILGVAVAVALPIVGYPFAQSLWMALDLIFDPPERTRWAEAARPDLVPAYGLTGAAATRALRASVPSDSGSDQVTTTGEAAPDRSPVLPGSR